MSDNPTNDQPMNEPGDFYEAAFHLLHPSGTLVRYTVHAANANECMKRQDFIIKNRIDGGYTVPAQTSAGSKNGDNPPQSQLCDGFMIVTDVINGKKSQYVKLPFKLANGETAKFPKQIMGSAVEQFFKALAAAGIQAQGGEYYEIPVKVTWRQGKEMPKKSADEPTKHYTDWLGFEFQQRQPSNPPAKKTPVNQPPQEEEIPF